MSGQQSTEGLPGAPERSEKIVISLNSISRYFTDLKYDEIDGIRRRQNCGASGGALGH